MAEFNASQMKARHGAVAELASYLNTILGGAPSLVNLSDAVTTTDASTTSLDMTVYQSVLTTGGSAGAEAATVGDGTGAVVGQRKLVTLGVRTDASDSVTLDHANIVAADGTTAATAVVLDAANEFLLLEWNGAKWQTIYASSGVVATA